MALSSESLSLLGSLGGLINSLVDSLNNIPELPDPAFLSAANITKINDAIGKAVDMVVVILDDNT